MTGLLDEGSAVDIVCLEFRKAFDTASYETPQISCYIWFACADTEVD